MSTSRNTLLFGAALLAATAAVAADQVARGPGPAAPVAAPAANAPSTPAALAPPMVVNAQSDLGPVLDKLSRAIDKLASQPARVVESSGAPAQYSSALPTQMMMAPEASSAMVGSLDNLMHFVPKLQQLGERLRGPKAKVILMDAGLVRTFEAFKEVHSLADAIKALEQLDL